jgi:hypothetical protein
VLPGAIKFLRTSSSTTSVSPVVFPGSSLRQALCPQVDYLKIDFLFLSLSAFSFRNKINIVGISI